MIKKIINSLLCIHEYENLSENTKIAFEKGYISTSSYYMICVLVAILYYILFPLLFIPRSIFMFIFWLLHVGRKSI